MPDQLQINIKAAWNALFSTYLAPYLDANRTEQIATEMAEKAFELMVQLIDAESQLNRIKYGPQPESEPGQADEPSRDKMGGEETHWQPGDTPEPDPMPSEDEDVQAAMAFAMLGKMAKQFFQSGAASSIMDFFREPHSLTIKSDCEPIDGGYRTWAVSIEAEDAEGEILHKKTYTDTFKPKAKAQEAPATPAADTPPADGNGTDTSGPSRPPRKK